MGHGYATLWVCRCHGRMDHEDAAESQSGFSGWQLAGSGYESFGFAANRYGA